MKTKSYPAFYSACRSCRKAIQDIRPLQALVLTELRAASRDHGQNTIAAHLGVSAAYLNDIIHERRELNSRFLDKVNAAAILEIK